MKNSTTPPFLFLIIIFFCLVEYMYAYDFKVANEDGIELAYNIIGDGQVEITFDTPKKPQFGDTNYQHITIDTLRIPSTILHNGNTYTVVRLGQEALSFTSHDIKTVYIPASIDSICYSIYQSMQSSRINQGTFLYNKFQSIITDAGNAKYQSSNGILYTKHKKVLVAFPNNTANESVILDEGVEIIANVAICFAQHIKYLDLPLTLKNIGYASILCDYIKTLVIKDSIRLLSKNSISCLGLTDLKIGANVDSVDDNFFITDSIVSISLRRNIPPIRRTSNSLTTEPFLSENILNNGFLYVPRQSVLLYKQADGWSQFKHILPIEPPIVTGAENAEVSWVQNFSATGYEWVLYVDESRTQLVMTLVFNAFGNLTELRLGDGFMPAPAARRMLPAVQNGEAYDEDTPQKRYAEYYSFNITGLRPGTTYWYSCRSMADGTVIEDDNGSFSTLSDGTTGLGNEGYQCFPPPTDGQQSGIAQPVKTIENGLLYIHRDNRTYTPFGWKVR